jgi:hypothetical protein
MQKSKKSPSERADLVRKVRELEFRIERLESQPAPRADSVSKNGAPVPKILEVVRITSEMFSGEIKVEIESDPEEPDVSFVVFNVRCAGNPQEIVKRQREWHQRISEISAGDSGQLRLSVVPL